MFVKTLSEFKQAVASLPKLIAVDTETTSLNPRQAELEGIGWGDGKKQYYIDWGICDFRDEAIDAFKSLFKTHEIIFHNAKFDIKIFKVVLGIDYPDKIHDTMIMSWLLNENRGHGLKDLTTTILKRKVVKYDQVQKEVTLFDDAESIRQEMADYCCADVKNTFDLFTEFKPKMEEEDLWYCYGTIELPLIKVLTDMELKGVTIDVSKLQQLAKKAESILLEKESLVQTLVGNENINIRSSKQLRDILFTKLNIIPERMTPSGVPSTDNETLKELAKENSAVQAILDFREFDKLNGTYLKGLQEKAEEGVLHTDFLQHRTRSGRLASANPNLQNIPVRFDEFDVRQAFVPRKGYKFIIADYSQIELRVVAYFSQEEAMTKIFNEGGDIHQLTADMVGCSRQHAKAINFGLIYGLGPTRLAKDLEISFEQAKAYMQTFFHQYPKLTSYISFVQNSGLYAGYVNTLTRRRRRFNFSRSSSKGEIESIKRKLINTKIQGSAADLMKIAMLRINRALKGLDAYMLIQIHDEVIVEAKEDIIDEAMAKVEDAMENAVKFNIPIPVEAKIADCWKK